MPCSQFSLYRRRKEFWLKVTVLNAENMMEDMEAQNKIDPVFNIYESIPCMKNCLPEKSPCAGFPFIMLLYVVPILILFLYLFIPFLLFILFFMYWAYTTYVIRKAYIARVVCLSATYDLWLKAESWSLNFKIKKKNPKTSLG